MTLKHFAAFVIASVLLVGAFSCKQEWPTDPPDVARPEIASMTPADATLMVPVGTVVTLAFNENMNLETLNACAEVRTGGGQLVPGSWNGANGAYAFAPGAALEGTTHYVVTVKGAFTQDGIWLGPAARDEKGNSLSTAFQSGFTTAGAYGNTTIYMGKSDVWGESGAETGLGIIKNLAFTTTGSYAGDGEVGLALTPSRQELYVADGSSHTVDVLDPATGTSVGSITLPDSIEGPSFIEFTPNGAEAWVLCRTGSHAVVINTATKQVAHVLSLADHVNGGTLLAMKINNAGTKGYISTGGGFSLIVVDIATKTVSTTISGFVKNGDPWAKAEAIAVTPDDAKIIVACDYALPQLAVIDAATNTVSQDLFLDALYNSDTFLQAKGNALYAFGRWGLGLMKIDMTTFAVTATNIDFATEGNPYGWMIGMTVGNDGVVYGLSYDGQLVLCKDTDLSKLALLPAAIRKNLVAY